MPAERVPPPFPELYSWSGIGEWRALWRLQPEPVLRVSLSDALAVEAAVRQLDVSEAVKLKLTELSELLTK